MTITKARAYLILPSCFLVLEALQEVVVYKMAQKIDNKHLLTLLLILMFAVGFSIVGDLIVPALKKIMEHAHFGSKKYAGWSGMVLLYSAIFGLIYILYYVVYIEGPCYLLPSVWR